MSNTTITLERPVNALREIDVQPLPERINQILQSWRQLIFRQWTEESFTALHRQVHSLISSGAAFDFPAISASAHAVDNYLKPLVASGTTPDDAELLKINALLGELRKACAQLNQNTPNAQRSGKLHILRPLRLAEPNSC